MFFFKVHIKKIKAETTINRHKFSYSAKTETTQNTCTYFSVIHYRTVKYPCFFCRLISVNLPSRKKMSSMSNSNNFKGILNGFAKIEELWRPAGQSCLLLPISSERVLGSYHLPIPTSPCCHHL